MKINNEDLADSINLIALYIALLTAWIAMLGSLYFSEVAGFIPCELCWYQRILMYPLAGIIAVGLLRRDSNLPYFVLPFSLIGQGFSAYHYLLEKTDLFDSTAVCQMGVSCTIAWINWLGFITIPFLALVAFFIITMMCVLALSSGKDEVEEEAEIEAEGKGSTPWAPVFGVIAVVMIAFGVLLQMGVGHAQSAPATSSFSTLAPSGESEQGRLEAADIALVEQGEKLYREACAACHGPDGKGVANLGASLVDSEIILATDDDAALAFIRAGVDLANPRNTSGLVMPPSGGRPDLSDEQLLAIVHYLRAK
jgi:disulfide bond formation protein DsbB